MIEQHPKSSLLDQGVVALILTTALSSSAFAANTPREPFNGRQSYSGSNMSCLIANDFYAVHFMAMQEGRQSGESTQFVKYCQQIPATGKTYLSLDLLDRDVRNTPIALRVVEEEVTADGRLPREKSTLAEVPAKIYRSRTADTHVEITQPGHYALIATIDAEAISEDNHLRIPFSVGLPPPPDYGRLFGRFTAFLVIAFFAVMGVIGYRTHLAYLPKRARVDVNEAEPESRPWGKTGERI